MVNRVDDDDDDEGSDAGNEDELNGEDEGDADDVDVANPLLHLPEYVIKRVDKLKELDGTKNSIMDNYLKERSELEQKFAGLLKPLFNERVAILKGEQDAEIAEQSGVSPPEETGEEGEVLITGVPHFWVTAMSNHEATGELLSEEDVDCLEHLRDIVCEDDQDGKGFTVKFMFAPNDYFENAMLTKRYEVPNLLLSDEPLIKQVEGCTINWKADDRCLTHRKFSKKQRGKGKKAGQIRTVTKTEKKESFFHWFDAPKMPTSVDNMDEEEVDEIEELFTDDFDVAQAFRREICPSAVQWYTGEAAEREMLEMMDAAEGGNEGE